MQLPYSEEVNIEAPRARDIERVRKYWKLIIQIAIMEKRLTTGGSGLLLPGGQSRQTAAPGTNATTAGVISGLSG